METGTYLGDSTEYVAKRRKDLPIFGCEINEDFFNRSQKRLRKFKNVKLYLSSSPEFLRELAKSSPLGNLPLFFLDAHWYDFWPLENEVGIITTFFDKAIIIIDDFKVPGKSEFSFTRSETDNRICDLELIKPKMNKKNIYRAIFPSYFLKEAFPIPIRRPSLLIGHIVIFQKLEKEFELIANLFTDKYFKKEIL